MYVAFKPCSLYRPLSCNCGQMWAQRTQVWS